MQKCSPPLNWQKPISASKNEEGGQGDKETRGQGDKGKEDKGKEDKGKEEKTRKSCTVSSVCGFIYGVLSLSPHPLVFFNGPNARSGYPTLVLSNQFGYPAALEQLFEGCKRDHIRVRVIVF